jgi:PKD repeat protein
MNRIKNTNIEIRGKQMRKITSLIPLLSIVIIFWGCSKDSGPTSSSTKPVASFEDSGSTVTPATITFQNTSQDADSYSWNFGDGTTSTITNPTKIYSTPGVYTVTLTATNAASDLTNSKSKQITITPGKVFIERIIVDQIPFTDTSGVSWDYLNGPDLYPDIYDNSNILVDLTSNHVTDIGTSELPLTWTLAPKYEITDWSKVYFVRLWDYDPLDSNDFIGSPNGFIINNVISNSTYPTTVSLQNSSGTIRVRVILKWQ